MKEISERDTKYVCVYESARNFFVDILSTEEIDFRSGMLIIFHANIPQIDN